MNKRSADRALVEGFVHARTRGGERRVRLHNLSAGGCLIEFGEAELEEGEQVHISLIDGLHFAGRVVWKTGDRAGVEFVDPTHPALIEHLKVKPARSKYESWRPRDRFGRTFGAQRSSPWPMK